MITLREAEIGDMRDLYDWRNHPEVRKSSFSTDLIPLDDHERWFRAKLADPATTIYIAFLHDEKAGSLRFDTAGDRIKVSVMLNPSFLGKGIGPEIIRQGTERYLREQRPEKPVIAEIRPENTRSRKAFRKAGFEESCITYVFKGEKDR